MKGKKVNETPKYIQVEFFLNNIRFIISFRVA